MKQFLFAVALLLCFGAPSALTAAQVTSRYTNAELVSINAQTRVAVIKNTQGKQETMQLDDTVAGLDGLRAGDHVILSLREEGGTMRVSSIVKSQASTPPAKAPYRPQAAQDTANASGLSSFSERVAALAGQAREVDGLWADFRTNCHVTLRSSHPDGREWFSLWEEGSAQMDVSSAPCRDLFNQIVGKGEAVKAGMVAAEEAARKSDLPPGELRDTQRRYSMEWGGYGLPAPDLLKQ